MKTATSTASNTPKCGSAIRFAGAIVARTWSPLFLRGFVTFGLMPD